MLIALLATGAPIAGAAAQGPDTVFVVQIKGEIDSGQVALVKRALADAAQRKGQAVLVELDTYGGLVDSAIQIRDALAASPVPTICYIKNRAWSAGALIALAHTHIAIAPGGSIGAAEPIPATEKSIAALKAEFAATANKTGRNPRVAEAMVDKTLGLPGYAAPGQVLALADYQAKAVGYVDSIAVDREQVLQQYGLAGAPVAEYDLSGTEKALGFLTASAVQTVLIAIVILALMTEIKTAGTGVAGAIGIGAAVLFFGSHWLAGVAGLMEVLLFIGGLFLIALELAVPGLGISGFIGLAMIAASLILALGGGLAAVNILAAGILLAIILFLLILRRLPSSKLWMRLVLADQENKQTGFVSVPDYSDYLGCEGVVVKQLHPAGIIEVAGVQLDVVSEGQFVARGEKVKVIRAEGNKIIVRTITEERGN